MTYAIYDIETGEILRLLTCTFETLQENLSPTEGYVEANVPTEDMMVVDGSLVPRPAEVLEAEAIEKAWGKLRTERDIKLKATDWTQIPDSPADTVAWQEYRQALRDLTEGLEDPRNVEWPVEPQ